MQEPQVICTNDLTQNLTKNIGNSEYPGINSNSKYPLFRDKVLKINDIPDHLMQNEIFAFLTSNDLFFNGRAVNTNWNEMVKNVWSSKIKEEMIDQVKSIDFIYEKEVFTKTYEFKLNYLINYKNLLTAYNNNANILTIIFNLVQFLNDQEVKNLIILFFNFINLQFASEYVIENQIETLKVYLTNEENYVYFKIKILEMMIIEDNLKEIGYLTQIKTNFGELNKEYLENISDFAKLIYSFLQGMIEYQILKVEVRDLKEKIENLLKKLQETSKSWPKKKKFLEKAYKLIIFNRNSTPKIRYIIEKFDNCKIRHPLIDYNDESIRMIYDLNKNLLNNAKEAQTQAESEISDEKIFENIANRRILLTKKMLILERFAEIYEKCKNEENESIFKVKDNTLTLKQLLWCMKISSNSQHENVTEETILRTKSYLDKNFDYDNHIIYALPNKYIRQNMINEKMQSLSQQGEFFDEKNIFPSSENPNSKTEESEISNSLNLETEKYNYLMKLTYFYKQQNECNNNGYGNFAPEDIDENTNLRENSDMKVCENCVKKQMENNKNNYHQTLYNPIKISETKNPDNKNANNENIDNNRFSRSKINELDEEIDTKLQDQPDENMSENVYHSDRRNLPAYGRNSRDNNTENKKIFNYRDELLEEEVKEAEDIVEQISRKKRENENMLEILESKEAEVNRLRSEKDRLLLKKQRTIYVLDMLKKFMTLKENLIKNRNYYKAIIFLLSRMRNEENSNIDNRVILTQIINSGELELIMNNENFQINFDVTEQERNDWNNFSELDNLLKEIEIGLLNQVNEIFNEKANEEYENSEEEYNEERNDNNPLNNDTNQNFYEEDNIVNDENIYMEQNEKNDNINTSENNDK